MPNDKNNLQSALKQLEAIVDDLSNKDVDVESGLAKFKTGVDLISSTPPRTVKTGGKRISEAKD